MILYECQGNSQHLYEMSKEGGGMCNRQMLPCNAIVAAWVKGSKVCQQNIIASPFFSFL